MAKLSSDKIAKLRTSIRWSRRKLDVFRQKRLDIIKQYVGSNYSDNGSNDRVPVNFIELATNIYVQMLAANAPRVLTTTPFADMKPKAAVLELAMNHLLKEIKFGESLQEVILDALFGFGIMKTAMGVEGKAEIGGEFHEIGQPFADHVSLDDFVIDLGAKKIEQASYMGNKYRVPFDVFKKMDFDRKAMKGIVPESGPVNGGSIPNPRNSTSTSTGLSPEAAAGSSLVS